MDPVTAFDGALLRIGLYLLLFWPTVGYYVYTDSARRGLERPRLRGLVLGFMGIVGLVVHLVIVGSVAPDE